MLLSAESAHLLRQAKEDGRDINKICIKWQHEMFEHLGIHRDFGVESLTNIKINFPSDRQMPMLLMRFAKICQCSVMKAMMPSARAGDVPRRFQPAKRLVSTGNVMPKAVILKFFKNCSEMLRSEESAKLLREAFNRGEDLQKLSIRWQREMIEHLGYEQEFGVNSMMLIPLYYGNDQRLLMEMQLFQQACQRSVKEATDPKMAADLDLSKRRFKPMKGKLLRSGVLPKKKYMNFFKECNNMLTSKESISILKHAKREGKNPGLISVKWQREIFESIGVEQNYGVECLNRIAIDFPKDKELQMQMMKFAKNCAELIRKVDPEGTRKALEAQKKKMQELKRRQTGMQGGRPVVQGKVLPQKEAATAPKEKTVEKEETDTAAAGQASKKQAEKPSEDDLAMMMMMMAMEEEKKKKQS